MTESTRPSYPPKHHFLRDLGIAIERPESGGFARIELEPALLDPTGRPRVGVLATLVDVIAGETAIRSVLPNWVATSDLSIAIDSPPEKGRIEAHIKVLRTGRQTIVLESELHAPGSSSPFALATLGFAVLPARANDEKPKHFAAASAESTQTTHFAVDGSGFSVPILEAIGIEADARDSAIQRLPVVPYLTNSLGAVQGGAVALLVESTAERFAAAELEKSVRVRQLALHYLKLGRVGPVRAEARIIAASASGRIVRVELFDEGANNALLTVGSVQID